MTTSAPPVVAGVDGSGSALTAVAQAARACTRYRLPLRLVHAYSLPTRGYPEVISTARELRSAMYDQGRLWLSQAVAVAHDVEPDLVVEHDLRMEHPVPTLLAESVRARRVVVGAHGLGGFTGAVVGSTALGLATYASCPVVVVRGDADSGAVVVGVDLAPGSDVVLSLGFEEASARGAPLVAAWSDGDSAVLAQRLARWREKFPDVAVSPVVTDERPVPMLLRLGASAQLMVVGCRGRDGFTGMLLGSTGQALVHHAPCSVAVVRT
ncbi:universal stress protein [Lentzea sp. NBRC 105346]|uniref:universal stress protein n=1 Tax=Lentzea sp. NBRC 105346 TaxID=3032205 RepID=UPI0024A159F9|nr:universal stress protein [Lentzea sp. NBRC 105346]GLZ31690.1 universal stress protein [Lentzea sp. NBRC 105346]